MPNPAQTQAMIDRSIAASGGGTANPLQNDYYVTPTGDDSSLGSIHSPFKTIAKANAVVGDAADNDEWNDPTKEFNRIHLVGGTFNEVVANVPIRPWVHYLFEGATAVGDWTRTFPQNLVSSGLGHPMILFEGASKRAGWDGSPSFVHNGIVGDVNFVMNGQVLGSWFPMHQFMHFAVDGDINYSVPAGTANLQSWCEDLFLSGQHKNPSASNLTFFGFGGIGNENAGDIEGIGGFTGNILLFYLNNVLISKDSSPTGAISGCQWYNTRILDTETIDFSGSSCDVAMDAASMVEYINGNSGLFTGTVSFLDQAQAVGLTVDTAGDWDVEPTEVKAALDELAARVRILEP